MRSTASAFACKYLSDYIYYAQAELLRSSTYPGYYIYYHSALVLQHGLCPDILACVETLRGIFARSVIESGNCAGVLSGSNFLQLPHIEMST